MRRVLSRLARLRGGRETVASQSNRDCSVYAIALRDRQAVPGTLRVLSPAGSFSQPMISRCGTRVAMWGTSEGADGSHIWVAAPDGSSAARRVTGDPGTQGHPYWHPDGRKLVHFASPSRQWEPRRQFAVDRPPSQLRWVDVDNGESTPLTQGLWTDERPAVAPDGRAVVFVSNRSGCLNLWIVDADGGGLSQLTQGPGPDYRPCVSPDGRLLAFFSAMAGAHQVRLISLATGEEIACDWTQRFSWTHGPYWYPDGRSLLVHGLERGAARPALWQIGLPEGQVRRVATPGLASASHGTVDDAERWLVFDSRDAPTRTYR
jgi:Tol biopolymer transport system component